MGYASSQAKACAATSAFSRAFIRPVSWFELVVVVEGQPLVGLLVPREPSVERDGGLDVEGAQPHGGSLEPSHPRVLVAHPPSSPARGSRSGQR